MLSRLFDGAATIGYLVFGLPMLVMGAAILVGSSLHPFGLLLGGVFAVAGGGAVLAAIQTWRRDEKTLSGPILMIAGIAGTVAIMVWAFTTSFGP